MWALLTEMEGAITAEQYYLSIGPGALLVHKIINIVVSFCYAVIVQRMVAPIHGLRWDRHDVHHIFLLPN